MRLEELKLSLQRARVELDGVLEWVRHCPMCGRELKRQDPMETVTCVCGWVWN